jgi:uncharacterized protein YdeI (BOF family)
MRTTIKRDLVFGFGLCVILFVCAVAWRGPLLQSAPVTPVAQVGQRGQAQAVTTFDGTIVKSGGEYRLRDATGQIYSLDDPHSARAFDGQDVQVTGQLDEQSMSIRVEWIRGAQS